MNRNVEFTRFFLRHCGLPLLLVSLAGILNAQTAPQSLNFGTVNVCGAAQYSPACATAMVFSVASPSFEFSTPSALVLTEGVPSLDFTLGNQTCAGPVCSFTIVFRPLHPGLRRGAVQIINSGGTISSTMIYGVGYGAQLGFGFSNQTISAYVQNPSAVAVNGLGTLYFSDLSKQAVLKATSSTSTQTITSGFAASALAFDGAGNLYVGDSTNQRVLMLTPSGQKSVIINNVLPAGLAVSGDGMLNIADQLNEQILRILPNGKTVRVLTGHCSGLAFDEQGNLYAQCDPNDLVKISSSLNVSIVNMSVDPTHANLALDPAGSMYASNTNSLFQLNPALQQTTASGGYPTGVALDNSANVYYADSYQEFIFKVNRSTPPIIKLLSWGVTRTQQIENTGNAVMEDLAINTTGAVGSTSNCQQSLDPGQSCTIQVAATGGDQTTKKQLTISFTSNGQTLSVNAPVEVFNYPRGIATTIQANPRQDSGDWVILGGAVYPAAAGMTGTMTYQLSNGQNVCILPLAGNETSCRIPASVANASSTYEIQYSGNGILRYSQVTAK